MINHDFLIHQQFSDDQFHELAHQSRSKSDFMRKLGYRSTSSWPSQVGPRCKGLGIKFVKAWKTKHTDTEVRRAAKNAKSVTETMRKLNLNYTGNAHARFRDRLADLGFVFSKRPWNSGLPGKKRNLNDYLMLNGPYIISGKLRRRLVKEKFKKAECEICGVCEWQGRVDGFLELDHIDGNRANNRLCNLQILCRNCHGQTDTHSRQKTYAKNETIRSKAEKSEIGKAWLESIEEADSSAKNASEIYLTFPDIIK